MKIISAIALLLAAACPLTAKQLTPAISGDYLEVRSCDVYTGPCFANAEMGLAGKEGILVWAVREGHWKGVALEGLSVIAVIRTDATLGDQRYEPRSGQAVLVVDAKATAEQREALTDLARSMAGSLIAEVVNVQTSTIETSMGACTESGCATVNAGSLIRISTRCFGDKDHLCGNEEVYYPPLTQVRGALPAFTELAAFNGVGLNTTWESTGQRSAFLATFTR